MTKFKQLCDSYVNWDEDRIKFRDDNFDYIFGFVKRMQDYFEFPDKYNLHNYPENDEKNYITMYSIVRDEEGVFQGFEQCSDPYDAISINNEGYFIFGLGFTLERGTDIFPKRTFQIGFATKIYNEQVLIKSNFPGEINKEFNFKISNKQAEEKVFEWVFDYLLKWLTFSPAEGGKKKQIGFQTESVDSK